MYSILPFLLVVLTGITYSLEDNKKIYRDDYTYFEEAEGYLKFHIVPAIFKEARLRCHLEGAVLASPINFGLKSAIEIMVRQDQFDHAIITGIHATFSRGDFFSIEGIPLSKILQVQEWVVSEGNTSSVMKSCLARLDHRKMVAVSCDEAYSYICYKKGGDIELNECGTTDNEYHLDYRTGSCYKFHRFSRTWSRAFMTCAAEGGHLAIINSDIEAEVIKDIFAKNPSDSIIGTEYKDLAFVGVNDWGEHGEFLTIHGQTLKEAGYDKFSPGEPNNSTSGEFCGSVYRNAMFNDLWCEKRFAFICEKNP